MTDKSDELKLVYVEYGTENNADGAALMEHPTDRLLERTRDRNLIEASLANDDTQGIVYANFGSDGHWHFDHHPTEAERKRERL